MTIMRKQFLTLIFILIAVAAPITPMSSVRAQDPPAIVDGRLQGYNDSKGTPVSVQLEPSGTATTWLMTGLLGAIAMGFIFMNPKRTHLD